MTFRDGKQLLGLSDSTARTRQAVERTTPFVGLLLTLLVLWFADNARNEQLAAFPPRPWYRTKRDVAVSDMLRAGRRALCDVDILELSGLTPRRPKVPHPTSKAHSRAS